MLEFVIPFVFVAVLAILASRVGSNPLKAEVSIKKANESSKYHPRDTISLMAQSRTRQPSACDCSPCRCDYEHKFCDRCLSVGCGGCPVGKPDYDQGCGLDYDD